MYLFVCGPGHQRDPEHRSWQLCANRSGEARDSSSEEATLALPISHTRLPMLSLGFDKSYSSSLLHCLGFTWCWADLGIPNSRSASGCFRCS